MRNDETGKLAFRRDDLAELTDEQLGELAANVQTLSKRVSDLFGLAVLTQKAEACFVPQADSRGRCPDVSPAA